MADSKKNSVDSLLSRWLPESARGVVDYPLYIFDGNKAITVGSIVTFIIVLLVGLWLAKLISRLSVRLVTARLKIHPGAAVAARSLIFYALAAIVFLLALKAIDVPLSVFAVAGGAIAIGVGFGSQNILNNFISGLILLIERPVRVGDIIHLEGPYPVNGVVREIGGRSTRLVTGENVEIVVPNSTLLQQNVVNWTLSDDEIRTSISVGVAYGSPVLEARDLLLEAAKEHGLVLKSPQPVVLLDNFGENAIILRLFFWMHVRRPFERRTVESDLRFKIEKTFRNSGIVIAFPQRDLHLHTDGPIPVTLDAPSNNTNAPGRAGG
jgi:potassium efflux system protein